MEETPQKKEYPTRAEEVAFRVIDGEAVLLHLVNGVYYTLNEVGSMAWELCDGLTSSDAIVTAISEEYQVDADTARGDLRELLDDLAAEGLVTIDEHAAKAETGGEPR